MLIAEKRFPDIIESTPSSADHALRAVEQIKVLPETIKPKKSRMRRTVFGEPIDFRGLRFAPVNEQGGLPVRND